jgi:diaminohydroxyphosphoribosylaminopyrimidine deaminase/5-amino-6-(5-phosphoribosylamino)uracil reductase
LPAEPCPDGHIRAPNDLKNPSLNVATKQPRAIPGQPAQAATDTRFMRLALALARRGCGRTSPNPMVGAAIVKAGRVIGRGWHRQAGLPHAEIEALRDTGRRGHDPRGATLYVTLEPCCTHGRTPPCTDAIIAAGIRRVVVGATDPNPRHSGRAFALLRRAGIAVTTGVLADECARLNEAFNHWIVHRTPFVVVKAAMTLDGKIATARGDSKWITGEAARAHGMRLRAEADAILVGINTVLADDPALTVRLSRRPKSGIQRPQLRRLILDSRARTPLTAKVVTDAQAPFTTVIVTRAAPRRRVAALAKRVSVRRAPARAGRVDLRWLLRRLGREDVTRLLVEGGGEVNASFLEAGLAQRVAFFYAPKIVGGRAARRGVAGTGARGWRGILKLEQVEWRRFGPDLFLTARLGAA